MFAFCVWLFSTYIFNPVGTENTQFSSLFFPVCFDVGILNCLFS